MSSKHYGISGIGSIIDVGKGGPKLKSTGGVLEARNTADNAYAIVRGATPIGVDDLTSKNYVDTGFIRYDSTLSYGFISGYIPTLSFSATTYEVTLTDPGSGWKYDRTGVRCNVTGNKSVRLVADPGGNPAPAANTYYIYIDATDGTLISSTSSWTLEDTKVPCAIVLWDDSATPKYHLADELHTSAMPRKWHWEHHFVDGAELISGGTISGYTVNDGVPSGDTDNTFGIAETIFCDEDKKVTNSSLSDPNGTDLAYIYLTRTGAATYGWGQSAVPFKYTTSGYINWNNGGTATEGQSGKFYCSYVLATNFSGDGRFMCMSGRGEYNTISEAAAESIGLFNWDGYPVAEAIVLYQLIWATDSSYTTKGKVRLTDVPFGVMSSATSLKNKAQEIKIRVLDDLVDVTIGSPQLDQSLRYNGFKWVNGPASAVSAGPGVEFYECTPVINSKIGPAGLKQDGTAGNGIRVNSLSRFPVITVSSTITVSIATPAVVDWTAHGLPISAPIVFTTTGALPTGITAGTTYYILSTSYGANSFRISASIEGAAINTSGTQSGVHTCTAGELANTGQAVSDTRAYAAWVSSVAVGRTILEAGLWDFTTFAGVNSVGGGRVTTVTRKLCIVSSASSGTVTITGVGANSRTATITSGQFAGTYFVASATNTLASYLQTPTGIYQITAKTSDNEVTITVPTGYSNESAVAFSVWNMLFGTTSVPITSITPSYIQVDASTAQPAFTVLATDRLAQIDFVTSNNTTTVTTSYNGSIRNTHFTTPLIITHNELSGLQGGTGSGVTGEFYHLTSAQSSGLTGGGSTALHSHAVPTTITVAAEASDTTCYPLFVTGASGDLAPKTHATFGFDALNGWLGVGIAVPTSQLHVADYFVNTFGTVSYVFAESNLTSDSTLYNCGHKVDCGGTYVSGGVTDSGYKVAIQVLATPTGSYFAGTQTSMIGVMSYAGIGASATSGAAVTNAYAGYFVNYNLSAGTTLTNAYGIYIDSCNSAIGTISHAWDIYAPNAVANSYIAGNLGLGTTGSTAADAPLRIQKNQTTLIRLASGTGANYFDIGRQVESGVPLGWLKFYGSQSGYGGYVFSSVDAGDYLHLHPSGVVTLGTADNSGTPATGKLVVQGSTSDGSTYVFVARSAAAGNVAWLTTAGSWACNGISLYGQGDSTANGGMYSLYDDGVHIWVRMGAGYGCGNIIFTTNIGVDHGHAAATSDPIVWIHSGTSPTGDNTEYIALSHNRTNALLDVGKGKLQIPSGVILGLDAATNTAGYIKMFAAGANAYYNTFTSGENTANATYTWPLAMPASSGYVLACTDAGVMSWAAAPSAATMTVVADTTDQTCYPLFVNAATGALAVKTHAAFGFDALNGWLGVGTATPQCRFEVNSYTEDANSYGAIVSCRSYTTTDASRTHLGLFVSLAGTYITASKTDSGERIGISVAAASTSSYFEGILTRIIGVSSTAGIGVGVSAGAVVTNAYGGYFSCLNGTASTTVTNAFGLYIHSKEGLTGTITNAWDIYAASTTSYNYFAGNVGIGVTSPGVSLEIQQVSDGSPIAKVTGANNPMWEVYSTYGSTSHRGAVQMVGTSSVMRVGTITDHPVYFSVHDHEVARFTTDLNFLIGTSDNDGTPAIGRLIVESAGNSSSTNIFVGRDSDHANQFVLNSDGEITTGSWHATTLAYDHGGTGLTAYPAKSIILPAASAALGTTTPATRETRELTTNKQVVDVLKFAHAGVCIAWWTFLLPDSYDGGVINAKITYMNIATDSTNNFLFSLYAGCVTDGEPLDMTMGTVQELVTVVGDTAEDLKIGSWSTGVTPSGTPAGGKLLYLKLQRDPTDTAHDTTSLDAYVLGLRLEYTVSSWTD